MPRFFVVIVLMSVGGLYILGNAAYLMFVESEYWTQVSRKLVKENVPIPAKRGNILSADGQIMASSLPEYKIYMDYVASDKNPETAKELQAWRDSVLMADLDSISRGLSKIFPDKTAGYFKKRLKKGKKLRRRNWQIYGRRISYIQYKECKKLPLFRESPFKGGFYAEEFNQRKKPYGSLAARTLGALYASKDSARYGLELSYDSILRGKEGVSHRAKVRNKWLSLVDAPPVDGNDIETTIDVSMQDALVTWLQSIPQVRKVNYSEMTANTLSGLNLLIAYVSMGIIVILLAVSIFLISNTVAIGISVRSEEINIMKYIGATDFFVRAPFVLEGMLIGLIGAAVPLGLIYSLYNYALNYIVERFLVLSGFLNFLSVDEVFHFLIPVSLGVGVGIGFLGSISTVRKHLHV